MAALNVEALDHLALTVTGLGASIAFYAEVLGMGAKFCRG